MTELLTKEICVPLDRTGGQIQTKAHSLVVHKAHRRIRDWVSQQVRRKVTWPVRWRV